MILLSVGTQLPFDRLVSAVDRWAADHRETEVIAQIGPARYLPRAMTSMAFIAPDDFAALQARATLMISHAGIGSIINAMEMGKPIIILPRDHRRGEHRNGHQLSTAERFAHMPGVYPARDEVHLIELLDRADDLTAGARLLPQAPRDFCEKLKTFIAQARPKPAWRLLLEAMGLAR